MSALGFEFLFSLPFSLPSFARKDGSFWAWGDNEFGQLGLGDITKRASPAKVWPRANPGLNLLLLVN